MCASASSSSGESPSLMTTQMKVWIVLLPDFITELADEVYQKCLNRLDSPSRARVKRFYHREDAWRSIIGMLLPYLALREYGLPTNDVQFARLSSGKPYLAFPTGMDFNVSHDKQMIAMVSSVGAGVNTSSAIGIDVMRRKIPKGETISSFIRGIDITLTKSELDMLTTQKDSHIAEKHIFILWTLKEAYTKALGLGLGFDFQRVEYHIPNNTIRIDGQPAKGWHFMMFEISLENSDVYQGCIAYFKDNDPTTSLTHIKDPESNPLFNFVPVTDIVNFT